MAALASNELMQSLMVDCVHFSNAIARFLFLEGRLGTRLYLHLTLWFP